MTATITGIIVLTLAAIVVVIINRYKGPRL